MRLLLTGSAGFMGRHCVEHLLKNTDWEIVGLDSFKHKGDSERVIQNDRFSQFTCDLSVPISYRLEAKLGQFDYIINMASESHVDRSLTDPVPFVQNNVNVALYVLEFARRQKNLQKFIQISTDEVFGAALEGQNHREWDRHQPSNPYAASKSCQTQIAISYWRAYGVPLIITQTMNIIGEMQDPEKFVPMLIQKINKGETVTIHGNEKYIGKRKYLHARNQADALLFLLNNVEPTLYKDTMNENIKPDNFNIVGDIELNNLELAKMVAEIMGKELKYELVDFHKARSGHDRRYALDGTKIRERGWIAPVSFKDSLKKTIQWTLAHKEWLI
jgi:dTDP-glucose 4,6-dehydratase